MRPALFLHIFDYQQQGRHTANFAEVFSSYLVQLYWKKLCLQPRQIADQSFLLA